MDGHDAVVHFAAETHVDRSIADGSKFVQTNCVGTNVLCDVANQVGVSRALLVMDVPLEEGEGEQGGNLKVMINPEITGKEGLTLSGTLI